MKTCKLRDSIQTKLENAKDEKKSGIVIIKMSVWVEETFFLCFVCFFCDLVVFSKMYVSETTLSQVQFMFLCW